MAQAWHATGPVQISLALDVSNPAYVAFARTDNEDLVSFEVEDIQKTFTRNDLGDMTAEVITTGSTCHIQFTATYWNEEMLDQMLGVIRLGDDGATEGAHAEVGALLVSSSPQRLFGIRLNTTRVGEKSYEFPLCRLAAPYQKRDLGNTMLKLVMVVEALPDGNGSFYSVDVNA